MTWYLLTVFRNDDIIHFLHGSLQEVIESTRQVHSFFGEDGDLENTGREGGREGGEGGREGGIEMKTKRCIKCRSSYHSGSHGRYEVGKKFIDGFFLRFRRGFLSFEQLVSDELIEAGLQFLHRLLST